MFLLEITKKLLFGAMALLHASTAYSEVMVATSQVSLAMVQTTNSVDADINRNKYEATFYQALVAEFYNQSGEASLTLDYYLPLALKSDDLNLVKRVTEIATGSAQLKKGLQVAKHWVDLSPDSLEARQYLTLLLLRNGKLRLSANQLQFIREIVEKGNDAAEKQEAKQIAVSKGLKFIGALLVVEAHHSKALRVFDLYIKQYGSDNYTTQQDLILASLAMEAKEYSVVVSALTRVEENGSLYFASAGLMKSKALQKLGRIDEATHLIKLILKTEKASDSLRLEFSRLLVSSGEKDEALQLIRSLVEKYPDNNDLLKALITLDIEQKNWFKAKQNNQKLSLNEGYKSDTNYFYGEISKAEGDLESALVFFKKVNRGIFKRRSHSKISFLIEQLSGLAKAQEWLQLKQQNATKKGDMAHWLKLEADLLSSNGAPSNNEQIKKAIKIYNKIVQLLPDKRRYYYYRGLLHERLGQLALAEEDFKTVLQKRKDDADALNALGFLLLKHTNRFGEAKKLIKQAYKLKPNDPTIMDSLGWVYYQTGEIIIAEDILRKAYKVLKTPEVASHLVTVLSESGQYDEAKAIIEEMKEKLPNTYQK